MIGREKNRVGERPFDFAQGRVGVGFWAKNGGGGLEFRI